MCFFRESLWDRPPIGYETLTPMQYKAMRGTYSNFTLIIKTFVIYIIVIYWHCHSALQTVVSMRIVRTLHFLFQVSVFMFVCC